MSTALTHIETEKQLIPELRFKEFEGNYSKRILKDFTKINQGLQIPISERYNEQVEGSYFYITNEFLRKGSKKSYFIKNPSDSVICFEEDILMTRTGNTGQVVTGVHGAFHNNFFKIKFDDTCEKWYLYFFLTSYITQHKILTLAGTSTIPDLNHGDFYKLKITMPKYPEQQKIASFLSAVDEKIQQLTKKKALLEQYKKGVMQQLFTGQLRFKEENGNPYPDWEKGRFSKFIRLYRGSSPRPIVKYVTNDEDGVNWIKIGDTKKSNNYRISSVSEKITKEGSLKSRVVIKGEIILANSMSFGKSYLLQIDGCIYDGWFVLREYEESFNKEFMLQILNSEYLQRQYLRLSTGGVVQNISSDIVYSTVLFRPVKEEQQKIATYLSSIDTKIENVTNQITQTQTFKKGLLQQMFV